MKPTTRSIFAVLLGWTIGISTLMAIGPGSSLKTYAQTENETELSENTEASNMTNMTTAVGPGGTIPSMSTPGEKTVYIFTSEIANVAEEKLKVSGDYYSLPTIIVNKDDKVTVHFYNVDDVKTERHSFTIGDPYKVDIDLGFNQSGNATFTADHTGVFTYYCRYHLPIMTGQLLVLP